MCSLVRRASLFAVILLGMVPLAQACPMCKAALSSEENPTVAGYFWSILFMLTMPYLILAGFALLIWRWRRQLRAAMARASVTTPSAAASSLPRVEAQG